jgi:vacuolar-type H+-ATPase subunit D/Vma8
MKSFFAKLAGIPAKIWSFYAPILKQLLVTHAAALLPIAFEIVRSLAETKKTGSQKREDAVKRLTTIAVNSGIQASESLIRFTVESAVQRLKNDE